MCTKFYDSALCNNPDITKIRKRHFMLPKDPMILLSYINTQLRDFYPSLTEMCKTMNLNQVEIEHVLKSIDYKYDEALNKFV